MLKFSKIKIFIFLIFLISLSLFIPHFSNAQVEEQVCVCPLARKMEEVNPRCDCRIDLILGETVKSTCSKNNQDYQMTLTITEYEGKEYYTILGFENGGAGVNLKPRAEISGKFEGIEGETLSFSASKSSDPNGDPLDFYFEFGDGKTEKGENVSHSYSSAGNYILKLIVDDSLASSTATTQIKIYKRETINEGIVFKQEKENQIPKIEETKEEAKEKEEQQEETQFPIPPIVKGAETRENKEIEKEEIKKEPEREIEIQKVETGEPFKKVFPSREKIPSKRKILFLLLPVSFLILLFLLRFFFKNVLKFKNDEKTKDSLN